MIIGIMECVNAVLFQILLLNFNNYSKINDLGYQEHLI